MGHPVTPVTRQNAPQTRHVVGVGVTTHQLHFGSCDHHSLDTVIVYYVALTSAKPMSSHLPLRSRKCSVNVTTLCASAQMNCPSTRFVVRAVIGSTAPAPRAAP